MIKQKLILLSIVLLILFSYPIISIPNKLKTIAGIPILYIYIFGIWIIGIILVYIIADKRQKNERS